MQRMIAYFAPDNPIDQIYDIDGLEIEVSLYFESEE